MQWLRECFLNILNHLSDSHNEVTDFMTVNLMGFHLPQPYANPSSSV